MKEIKDDLNKQTHHVHVYLNTRRKTQHSKDINSPLKLNCSLNVIVLNSSKDCFVKIYEFNLKFIWKGTDLRTAKTILKRKNKAG